MAGQSGIRRVAVTGASGFIGRRLAAALVADGIEVTALSRGKGLFEDRPIPVTVVPGGLDKSAIDALT